jgi:hypothetical protein
MEAFTLSNKATEDLRTALKQSYGENFDVDLSDEDIYQIGVLFLDCVASYLKMLVSSPEITEKSL